jgi:hypothetical protein
MLWLQLEFLPKLHSSMSPLCNFINAMHHHLCEHSWLRLELLVLHSHIPIPFPVGHFSNKGSTDASFHNLSLCRPGAYCSWKVETMSTSSYLSHEIIFYFRSDSHELAVIEAATNQALFTSPNFAVDLASSPTCDGSDSEPDHSGGHPLQIKPEITPYSHRKHPQSTPCQCTENATRSSDSGPVLYARTQDQFSVSETNPAPDHTVD